MMGPAGNTIAGALIGVRERLSDASADKSAGCNSQLAHLFFCTLAAQREVTGASHLLFVYF